MTLIPWAPPLIVILSASLLVIGLVRLHYHRQYGTPLPPRWHPFMGMMLGNLLFFGHFLLPENSPAGIRTIFGLAGATLQIAIGAYFLHREFSQDKLAPREEPLQTREPEQIANR